MNKALLILLLVISCSQDVLGQKSYNLEHGVALDGYDPVSYFDKGPQKGKTNITATQQGIIYRFANTAHLATFKQAPDKYLPQYGGWCAYAMGNSGEKIEVDPETYKMVSGKLYLFYNKYFNNTLKSWNKNEAELKMKADANWQKLNK